MGKSIAFLIGAFLGIFLCATIYLVRTEYQSTSEKSELSNTPEESVKDYSETFTMEERINSWELDKKFDRATDLYYELPQTILEAILTEIGTEASVEEIYDHYQFNKKHYLQLQIANEIDKVTITGPDKDNIEKAEISVDLKEPLRSTKDIPIIPAKSDTTTRPL